MNWAEIVAREDNADRFKQMVREERRNMGTTWRYVAAREKHDEEDVYTIRELYTDESGKISWTNDPIAPNGSSWSSLCADALMMAKVMVDDEILDLTLDPPALVDRRELQ